jgi:hypothetical protein
MSTVIYNCAHSPCDIYYSSLHRAEKAQAIPGPSTCFYLPQPIFLRTSPTRLDLCST